MRKYTKQQLKKLFSNLKNKAITDTMAHMLIDETYNEEPLLRTSGFYAPGAGDSVMTWDDVTRKLLLEPLVPDAGGETIYDVNGDVYVPHFRFYVWERGPVLKRRYAYDAENSELPNPDEIELPNEEGLFAVYYDFNQTNRRYELTYTKAPDLNTIYEIYVDKVVVAWIYWDAVNGEALYVGDSRHGSQFNPHMQWAEHQTLNSQRQSGLKLTDVVYDGDGTLPDDYQFGISAGELWHEDIYAETEAVGTTEGIPVWYFTGGLPRFLMPSLTKFLNTGTGRVAWNDIAGPAEATNNYFIAYHLFATNCTLHPHISVMGQAEHETLGAAIGSIEAEIATLRQELPHSNLMHIASVVLQTSDDYTNTAKAIIVYTSAAEDVFVTDMDWNAATGDLTLFRSANRPELVQRLDISSLVIDAVNNFPETIIEIISNVAQQIVQTGMAGMKESYLIEETTLTEFTQLSSWEVIAFNELVGHFKAVVVIHDLSTHAAVTLQNTFGFDYTDPANEVEDDNAIITDGSITLVLSVDATTDRLKAVVSGMTSNSKRLHFCFERCVLGKREIELAGTADMALGMEAEMDTALELGATAEIALGMEADMEEVMELEGTAEMAMEAEGELTAEEVPAYEAISFGLLYSGFTALLTGNKSITSSDDWRLLSYTDLSSLSTYLGGGSLWGGKMKEVGEVYWTGNVGADNSSKFNFRGGGYRNSTGVFQNIKATGTFWIDYILSTTLWGYIASASSAGASIAGQPVLMGKSIRLRKVSTNLTQDGDEGTYTGNDGKIYRTICINGVEYLADNLAETELRDHSAIPEVTSGWDNYLDIYNILSGSEILPSHDGTNTIRYSQKFYTDAVDGCLYIEMPYNSPGSPNMYVFARLYTEAGGLPDSLIETSATYVGSYPTSGNLVFIFRQLSLSAGNYCIVLDYSSENTHDGSNHITISADNTNPYANGSAAKKEGSGSWELLTGVDLQFSMVLGLPRLCAYNNDWDNV